MCVGCWGCGNVNDQKPMFARFGEPVKGGIVGLERVEPGLQVARTGGVTTEVATALRRERPCCCSRERAALLVIWIANHHGAPAMTPP